MRSATSGDEDYEGETAGGLGVGAPGLASPRHWHPAWICI